MFPAVIAGMAGLGLAKGLLDQKKEEKDRKQAAEMARWSPWTGMQPNQIRQSDLLGSVMQGGMTGAMLGGLGGGGTADVAQGGAATTADPGMSASLAGGQSVDPMLQGGYNPNTFNDYLQRQQMQQMLANGAQQNASIPWQQMVSK